VSDPIFKGEPELELLGADNSNFVVPQPAELTTQAPAAPRLHAFTMVIGLSLPFLGLVVAMWLAWQYGWFDRTQFLILAVGYLLTGLGITLGYHRMLTHRAFDTYPVIRAFWMMLGALSVQMSPLDWCATHRKHHALSDRPGDPHSPHEYAPSFINTIKGLWHAHSGWLLTTGHIIKTDHNRYVPDLVKDPVAQWIHRTWVPLWYPLAFLIPTAISWWITGTSQGALMGFLWGGCARVFLAQHSTFSINSVCHVFGKRDYQTKDESRNNLICAIYSGGEGFHNNHHAFPSSARHGLEWWQFDLTWCVIRLMQLTGLAWNVKLPSAKLRESKRISAH